VGAGHRRDVRQRRWTASDGTTLVVEPFERPRKAMTEEGHRLRLIAAGADGHRIVFGTP
jgi:hypothetical protein